MENSSLFRNVRQRNLLDIRHKFLYLGNFGRCGKQVQMYVFDKLIHPQIRLMLSLPFVVSKKINFNFDRFIF